MRYQGFAWFLALSLLTLGACGNNETNNSAGEDMGADMADMSVDMPAADTTAPTVTERLPTSGATQVARAVQLAITFSEAMDPSAGTLTLTPGGETLVVADGVWNSARTTFYYALDGLPAGATIEVTLNADFKDVAGNALAEPLTWTFTTDDDTAPEITSASPAEGAAGVSVKTDALTLSFSRPMAPTLGTLTLRGGPGELGTATWASAQELRVPVSGLGYGAAYRLALGGVWRDTSGNRVDLTKYLGDGVLNFTTGQDTDPPVVAAAVPSEGQQGVAPVGLSELVVTFDEVMDVRLDVATLAEGGGEPEPLRGKWDSDGQTIRFPVRRTFAFEQSFKLDLSGLKDQAGNAVDATTYLGDGALDFTIGADTYAPVVRGSAPGEAEIDVRLDLREIVLVFSEAMDPSTFGAVTLTGGAAPITLTPEWRLNDTTLALVLPQGVELERATVYEVALPSTLADMSGNVVDPSSPYLGDGILQFITIPPSGEDCSQPLTTTQGTRSTGGAGGDLWKWSLTNGQALVPDGSGESCDPTGGGRDLVIRYEKTSDTLANGGKLLAVRARSLSSTALNLEISTGACNPQDAAATIPSCSHSRKAWDSYLDVGPGTYYVWVSSTTASSTFPGADVEIEEIAAPPEGETCHAPFTTQSPNHSGAGTLNDPHIWTIGTDRINSASMASSSAGAGIHTCDANQIQGVDAVIQFDKQFTSTLLEITVSADVAASDLNVELFNSCDTLTGVSQVCQADDDQHSFTVRAPAGPYWLWLATENSTVEWPNTTVSIKEVSVPIGDSCATAYPIPSSIQLPYMQSVLQTSNSAYDAPSCAPAASNIEWYSYTVQNGLLELTTSGLGAMAVIDTTTSEQLTCEANLTGGFARVLPVGTQVCIAVERGSFGEFTLNDVPYPGIKDIRTPIPFTRPLNSSGTEQSVTSDYWMAVTASKLYMAYTSSLMFELPRAGGQAVQIPEITSSTLGYSGVAVGEDVFGYDGASGLTTSRVYKLIDAQGVPETPWDDPASYPVSTSGYAMTANSTHLIYATKSSSETHFYALPLAASATPTYLGKHIDLENVTGIAADDTYLYVVGENITTEGVWRISMADLAINDTAPITMIDVADTYAFSPQHVFLDSLTNPTILYWRTYSGGQLRGVLDPAGASPRSVGAISSLGKTGDYAFTYARDENAIYLFETTTASTGALFKLTP